MNNEIKITTTEKFDGIDIIEYLSPVISHVVLGMNVFKDLLASLTDIIGGNSSSYESTLEEIDKEAINKLKLKALELGANCILNLKIENDEISSKDKSMLMVTAIGTAAICDFTKQNIDKIINYKSKIEEISKTKENQEINIKNQYSEYLVKKYNIYFKDDYYFLDNYKYSKIEDAIKYAETLEKKK